jgi:hypothetical protein
MALTIHHRFRRRSSIWLLVAVLLGAPPMLFAQNKTDDASPAVDADAAKAAKAAEAAEAAEAAKAAKAAEAAKAAAIEAYIRARTAFGNETEAYWQSITDKRGARIAKRRKGERIVLADYVLEQPPVYSGPPRPPGYVPRPSLKRSPASFPTVPEFLAAAERKYNFVPDRPKSEAEFQQAYAKVATQAGLTREQAVRIYAFETGGNGEYDMRRGSPRTRTRSRSRLPSATTSFSAPTR